MDFNDLTLNAYQLIILLLALIPAIVILNLMVRVCVKSTKKTVRTILK